MTLASRRLAPPTGETLAEYEGILQLVIVHRRRIMRMSERYPVYIIVAGEPYRLDSPADVDRFVVSLQELTGAAPRGSLSLSCVDGFGVPCRE